MKLNKLFGILLEENMINIFGGMKYKWCQIKRYIPNTPKIVRNIFELPNSNIEIAKSVLSYAVEFYLQFATNLQPIILRCTNDDVDLYTGFLLGISEFLHILNLSDQEYDEYLKAQFAFEKINELLELNSDYEQFREIFKEEEIHEWDDIIVKSDESIDNILEKDGKLEKCPITLQRIKHPYITSCGHEFEKDAILMHFEHDNRCPLCRRAIF